MSYARERNEPLPDFGRRIAETWRALFPGSRLDSYGQLPVETLASFRDRIERYWSSAIGPVPARRVRGRNIATPLATLRAMADDLDRLAELGGIPPRAVDYLLLAAYLDQLAEVGRIPSREVAPPAPAAPPVGDLSERRQVRIPHIVEAKDGKIVYFLRNSDEARPTAADYERVARRLLPARRYRAYAKRVLAEEQDPFPRGYNVGIGDDGHLAGGPEFGLRDEYVEGTSRAYAFLDRDLGAGMYLAEGPWQHISMVADEDDNRYENRRRQLGAAITAGRLEAFGRERISNDPPPYVVGWMVALVPLGDEGLDWLAMRAGERNCVAEAIRASLKKSCKLTDTRMAAIAAWEAKVVENGAGFDDTDSLATALKMRIRIFDAAGALLHEKCDAAGRPVYANGMKAIDLYRSDGHCSAGTPNFPAPTNVVIDRAAATGPAPPPADESPSQRRHREEADEKSRYEYAVSVIRRHKLDRAQIVGVEVVDGNGVIYRPLYMDVKLHEAAVAEGVRKPMRPGLDGQDLHEMYDEEWGDDGHVLVDGKPEPVNPGWKPVKILRLGGVQALKFNAWLDRSGILSLWAPSRVAWRMATIEAIAWTAEGESRSGAGGHLDMRAAYLACDSMQGHGPARAAADRFGFPRGGRSRVCLATTVSEVAHLAGFIVMAELTLAPHTPVAIAAHIANHFKNRHAPLPIPAAVWLCEHGYLASYTIAEVEYTDRMSGILFPNDRDLGVRMVGSCAYRDSRRTLFTRDPAEKDHFAAMYGAMPTVAADGFVLNYAASDEVSAKSRDHSHIRTYVLAYQAIAMWTAIEALGDNLIGTSADSVLVRDRAAAERVLDVPQPGPTGHITIGWGQFRAKTQPKNQPAGPVGAPTSMSWSAPAEVKATTQAPIPALGRSLTSYLEPGGFGKTTRAIREADASGRRFTILVPTNLAQINKTEELHKLGVNVDKFCVMTFHQFFHCSPDNAASWEPAVMGSAGLCVDGIIWDEYPIAGVAFLTAVLPWLRRTGICTILCGDPEGQLQEFDLKDQSSGARIIALLERMEVPFEYGTGTDWRAKDCPRLQAAKAECWRKSDWEQLTALRSIATPVTLKEMMALWDPRDAIIEPTNKCGGRIEELVDAERRKRFPDAPVRCMFKPDDRTAFKKKNGVLPKVCGPDKVLYPAAIGSTITVTAAQYAKRDKKLWKADSRITVHSVQGETIKRDRKIFICLENMPAHWCRNAVYVAMSRAEVATQLYTFRLTAATPPVEQPTQYAQPDYDLFDLVYE